MTSRRAIAATVIHDRSTSQTLTRGLMARLSMPLDHIVVLHKRFCDLGGLPFISSEIFVTRGRTAWPSPSAGWSRTARNTKEIEKTGASIQRPKDQRQRTDFGTYCFSKSQTWPWKRFNVGAHGCHGVSAFIAFTDEPSKAAVEAQREHCRSILGMRTSAESCHWLLRAYATNSAKPCTVCDSREDRHRQNETEEYFFIHLRQAVAPCGDVFSPYEVTTMFMEGLLSSLRPLLCRQERAARNLAS